jgi:FAD/FMN-containing dehydrogenase
MRIDPYNPSTTLLAVSFDDLEQAGEAVLALRELNPSAMEVVDDNLLTFIDEHNPNQLKGVVSKPFAKITLLVEFDDIAERHQKRQAKKAQKILKKYNASVLVTRDPEEQEKLWKIRRSAAAVIWETVGNSKALPIIEDGVVPPEKFPEFIKKAYELYDKYGLRAAVWGHAGDAHLHMQPFLDLSQVGDRQKVFRIMDDYHHMVLAMGGSTAGEHNDGRLRAPYLPEVYGPEMYTLFQKVKQIFDPYGPLNPGVKVNVTVDTIKPLLRNEYSMQHLYDHMPRT